MHFVDSRSALTTLSNEGKSENLNGKSKAAAPKGRIVSSLISNFEQIIGDNSNARGTLAYSNRVNGKGNCS